MKKKVILLFVLLLWGLAACTLLSLRIEVLMAPKVVLVDENVRATALPMDCLMQDEDGDHLFTVVQGSGWNSGRRANEVSWVYYTVSAGSISMSSYGETVQYATKLPRHGYPVKVLSGAAKDDDQWLVTSQTDALNIPDNVQNVTVEQTSDTAVLLSVQKMPTPFMPGRAKSELKIKAPNSPTVYSLNDVQAFMDALPQVAGVLALFPFALILWTYSVSLSKSPRKHRTLLCVNGAAGVLLLLGMAFLLNGIELPSSLLPQNSILQFSHYGREFSEIFSALQNLSAAGNETAATVLSQAQTMLWVSLGILIAGCVLGVGIVLLEKLVHRKNKFVPKHAAGR